VIICSICNSALNFSEHILSKSRLSIPICGSFSGKRVAEQNGMAKDPTGQAQYVSINSCF
jgi:hypothetical protein